jgi:hypothetical protein
MAQVASDVGVRRSGALRSGPTAQSRLTLTDRQDRALRFWPQPVSQNSHNSQTTVIQRRNRSRFCSTELDAPVAGGQTSWDFATPVARVHRPGPYAGLAPANTGGPQPSEAHCPAKSEEPAWSR